MKIDWYRGLVVAAAGGLTAVALATPAQAHHNAPLADSAVGECGTVTWTTWWPEDDHQVDNTALVVLVDGQVHHAPIGEELITPGVEQEAATIQWRIWGGGERDYDSPALTDLDALVAHLDAGGGELDADAPGVAWHEMDVYGCPPDDDPDPTPAPVDPTTEPTTEPTKPADPGKGGGKDDQGADELPLTGASMPILLAGGLGLAMAGGLAWLVGRRKRVSFTA